MTLLAVDRATRVRHRVVAMAVLMAMVTYLDRVCISKLAPQIMADLSLSKVQMGYVFSAFALAYALFEVPTGAMADRLGTRMVLTRIVVWWSAFTLATAAAFNYVSLLAARFLFGAGEAGAWPSAARTFSRWVPLGERGRVQGIFFAGAHLAGGITPLLTMFLLQYLSWRMIFVVFGFVGLAWALWWWHWFRDDPAEHPDVNQAERDYIQAGRTAAGDGPHHMPWGDMLGSNMLAMYVMYFPNSFVFYFCITWLPTYLHERHGFDATSLGFLAGLPLLLSVVGDLSGGVITDSLTKRFGPRVGRTMLGAAAYVAGASMLVGATMTARPVLAAVLIAVAVSLTMFTLAASWGLCLDIGGQHAGVVSAAMNTSGQVGGMLCPLIVAYSLQWFGNWDYSIWLMAGLFIVGAAAWLLIDPRRPLGFKNIAQIPST